VKHGGDRKSKDFEDAQKRALKSAIEQARQNRAKVKKAAEDFRRSPQRVNERQSRTCGKRPRT
jgi:hypothetical protein